MREEVCRERVAHGTRRVRAVMPITEQTRTSSRALETSAAVQGEGATGAGPRRGIGSTRPGSRHFLSQGHQGSRWLHGRPDSKLPAVQPTGSPQRSSGRKTRVHDARAGQHNGSDGIHVGILGATIIRQARSSFVIGLGLPTQSRSKPQVAACFAATPPVGDSRRLSVSVSARA